MTLRSKAEQIAIERYYRNKAAMEYLPPHPVQPIIIKDGVLRFRPNVIVSKLYEVAGKSGYTMNDIVPDVDRGMGTLEDYHQFIQLIGYSVGGAGALSRMDQSIVDNALRTPRSPFEEQG